MRVSVATALIIVALIQPGCLFRKKKDSTPQFPTSPIKIVLLPFNVPESAELRWLSLGGAIQMAKELEHAQDLEAVPLWQGLPAAIEALGSSRSLTPESAAFVAERMSARWAALGEITPGKNGISLLVDFIPAKRTLIAFRYEKEFQTEALGTHLREAFEQFLRYLVARPLARNTRTGRSIGPAELRQMAEAIDREYGWFAAPEPGKATQTAATLARSDNRLARLLFNPALYPESGARPSTQLPQPSGTASQSTATTTPSPPADNPPPVPVPRPAEPQDKNESKQPRPPAEVSTSPIVPSTSSPSPRLPPVSAPPPAPTGQPPKATQSEASPATKESTRTRMQTFKLQVFASRSKEEAEIEARKLTKAGFTTELERVDLKEKGIWYRLRLLVRGTRQAAEAAGRKLQADGLINEYWIVTN